jgi:AmmeMemoRadiSam system protein B
MNEDQPLPAVRPLQVTPHAGEDGRLAFILHDVLQIAPGSLAVSPTAYFLMTRLDGTHSIKDLQAAFQAETALADLPAEEIQHLVSALDQYGLLETPRFHAALEARQREYRAASTHDIRPRWPGADLLGPAISDLLAGATPQFTGEIRGLIAPHLDYQRGAPCYAAAYAVLAQAPPADRYVILGTNHFGRARGPVATAKDFETPFGMVTTDRTFIKQLAERLNSDLCQCDMDHTIEHSVELQVMLLQRCLPASGFAIVPILCPDVCGLSPDDGATETAHEVARLADALKSLIADDPLRTIFIAGADLSHVGLAFGDEAPATPESLADVERTDQSLLDHLLRQDHARFRDELRISANPTRVCSTGCLYAISRALSDCQCHLLAYHQAVDARTDTNVTSAAAVFA